MSRSYLAFLLVAVGLLDVHAWIPSTHLTSCAAHRSITKSTTSLKSAASSETTSISAGFGMSDGASTGSAVAEAVSLASRNFGKGGTPSQSPFTVCNRQSRY
jgi:hypothetical protein